MTSPQNDNFEQIATGSNKGVIGEFLGFMKDEAKWWLIPFLVVFLLLAGILALGATGAAPFLYTLF